MTVDTSFARRFIDIERESGKGRTWQQALRLWLLPSRSSVRRRRSNRDNRLLGISNRHWMLFFLVWWGGKHHRTDQHRRQR